MDEAEEVGYEGTYFAFEQSDPAVVDLPSSGSPTDHTNFPLSTSPPVDLHLHSNTRDPSLLSDAQLVEISSSPSTHHTLSTSPSDHSILVPPPLLSPTSLTTSPRRSTFVPPKTKGPVLAEAIYFDYGVSVFFGFTVAQERDLLEDCENGGTWVGTFGEIGQGEDERGWEKVSPILSFRSCLSWLAWSEANGESRRARTIPDASFRVSFFSFFLSFCRRNATSSTILKLSILESSTVSSHLRSHFFTRTS